MSDAEGGFFDRWSRRKLEQRVAPAAVVPAPAADAAGPAAVPPDGAVDHAAVARTDAPAPAGGAPPQQWPTLADAERLTPDSDFKPFVARGVAPGVRNAAMKKLFADPHFNVMDGLDTYIDDYSVSDPIPVAMLRQMASAKFLNLFADAEEAPADSPAPAAAARVDADTPETGMLAQSPEMRQTPWPAASPMSDAVPVAAPAPEPTLTPIDHDHPDLRLQPDHAAAAGRTGRGPA